MTSHPVGVQTREPPASRKGDSLATCSNSCSSSSSSLGSSSGGGMTPAKIVANHEDEEQEATPTKHTKFEPAARTDAENRRCDRDMTSGGGAARTPSNKKKGDKQTTTTPKHTNNNRSSPMIKGHSSLVWPESQYNEKYNI